MGTKAKQPEEAAAQEHGPVDVLIITALKKERNAILVRLDAEPVVINEESQPITYYRGHLGLPGSEERYEVVVALPQDMGNVDAAIIATRAIERWRPAVALMVGIGGGVKNKVNLGDVAVAKFVHYYEPGKVTPTGRRHRFEQLKSQHRFQQLWCNRVLFHQAFLYEASEWKGDVRQPIPGEQETAWKPDARFGPIGSGEQVVADPRFLQTLLDDCPTMIAVAMEGAGIAKAISYFGDEVAFLEIRGISDLADENKGDEWQEVAADVAAAFAIGFLRTRPFPPRAAEAATSKIGLPLLLLRAESLRQIGNAEVLTGLPAELQQRDISIVSLDFTDLVDGKVLRDPATAVTRLVGPQSTLMNVLAQRDDAEIVFCGLAHIPLLVLAGHVVSDRQKVYLMDYHPSPGSETWTWPEPESAYPSLVVRRLPKRGSRKSGDAIVRMSVSYPVHPTQTEGIVHDPVVSIDIAVPDGVRNVVKSETQVRAYGQVFRQTLDGIVRDFPGVERVHLFYAGPVSLAFHIGQQISENIHPTVIVWNYQRTYTWAIDLRAALAGEYAVIAAPTSAE